MGTLASSDWDFSEIRKHDALRAARLERAGSSDELISALENELERAIGDGKVRFGLDSVSNEFKECRVIIQFSVNRDVYDWFFNARTGYRAQFWVSPEVGLAFNQRLVDRLRVILCERLTAPVEARRIIVQYDGQTRQEKDGGECSLRLWGIERSLVPQASKIWICERLIQPSGRDPENIGFAVLSSAQRSMPKLMVPKWSRNNGEGLRAPYPEAECSWLDLKGAFICDDGARQLKVPLKRATDLFHVGWT